MAKLLSSILIFISMLFQPPQAPSRYVPPVAFAQPSELTSISSPDGKSTLSLKKEKVKEGTKYTFSVSDKEILDKTLPLGSSMSIPFNTFSPNDKYVLLKEDDSGKVSFLVVPAVGGGIQNISDLFTAKYQDLTISDVTGWGGQNLVVVNTDKKSGGQGPSFWFEVGPSSFIQLSTRFN